MNKLWKKYNVDLKVWGRHSIISAFMAFFSSFFLTEIHCTRGETTTERYGVSRKTRRQK